MINGIRLKVCGLTSLVDAEAADASGADYLGFIFYPASPRYVSFANYEAMRERLPLRKKVAVSVEPTLTDLVRQRALGFDHFQIHCPAQTPFAVLQAWADTVGAARLWLAPRSPAAMPIPPELLAIAGTILLDTYHPDKMGGTGEAGDWTQFKAYREAHPAKHWILSGGLGPTNILAAVTATGTTWVDVNSGVEQAPGIKSPAKLQALRAAMHPAAH